MDREERRLAGIAALRQVRRDMEVAERPRCQDCRFGPVRQNDPDICEHFAHWKISPDRRLSIRVSTGQARSVDGLCGPEALLFKPYAKWRLVPRWLARKDPETAAWIVFAAIIGTVAAVGALIPY